MVEGINVVSIISQFGLSGIIFVIWYFDSKRLDRAQADFQKHLTEQRAVFEKHQTQTLSDFREHLAERRLLFEKTQSEMRSMYERQVDLIDRYASLANNLKDLAVMGTESITRNNNLIMTFISKEKKEERA